MTIHDNENGPCACGAWHHPGDRAKIGGQWEPLHNDDGRPRCVHGVWLDVCCSVPATTARLVEPASIPTAGTSCIHGVDLAFDCLECQAGAESQLVAQLKAENGLLRRELEVSYSSHGKRAKFYREDRDRCFLEAKAANERADEANRRVWRLAKLTNSVIDVIANAVGPYAYVFGAPETYERIELWRKMIKDIAEGKT